MKFSAEVSFDLGTTVEPEINDYNWDNSQVKEFNGNSYWSGGEITASGGSFSFEFEADGVTDEDEAADWVREEIIREDSEIEDNNGITWVVENLDITVEAMETELPSLDEALVTLGGFAEQHREDEEWGEVARAAIVVIDAFRSHTARLSALETQVATLVAAAEAKTDHPF